MFQLQGHQFQILQEQDTATNVQSSMQMELLIIQSVISEEEGMEDQEGKQFQELKLDLPMIPPSTPPWLAVLQGPSLV